MIAIVGDANREHAWKNMTQEARQLEILRPAVKEIVRVEVIKRLPEHVRRAFAVATSGRPGPVIIDVPEDIAHSEHDFDASDFWIDPETLKAQSRRTRPDGSSVEKAATRSGPVACGTPPSRLSRKSHMASTSSRADRPDTARCH